MVFASFNVNGNSTSEKVRHQLPGQVDNQCTISRKNKQEPIRCGSNGPRDSDKKGGGFSEMQPKKWYTPIGEVRVWLSKRYFVPGPKNAPRLISNRASCLFWCDWLLHQIPMKKKAWRLKHRFYKGQWMRRCWLRYFIYRKEVKKSSSFGETTIVQFANMRDCEEKLWRRFSRRAVRVGFYWTRILGEISFL